MYVDGVDVVLVFFGLWMFMWVVVYFVGGCL